MLPWGFSRYPGILHGEVLHRWFYALAEYLFRLSIRDTNKHFWRRCRGSNWLKLSYNWVRNLTVLSPLILAGLPLLSLSLSLSLVYSMQSNAWPVLIYHPTSIEILRELGELWDTASSHPRRNPLGNVVCQSQHHPWPRLSGSTRPRPAATSLLDWTMTKAMMDLS